MPGNLRQITDSKLGIFIFYVLKKATFSTQYPNATAAFFPRSSISYSECLSLFFKFCKNLLSSLVLPEKSFKLHPSSVVHKYLLIHKKIGINIGKLLEQFERVTSHLSNLIMKNRCFVLYVFLYYFFLFFFQIINYFNEEHVHLQIVEQNIGIEKYLQLQNNKGTSFFFFNI